MVESDIEENTATTATGESVKDPPPSPNGRSSLRSKGARRSTSGSMSMTGSVSILSSVDREVLRSQLEELNNAEDEDENGRQAKLCCGVLCDLIKGVVIADITYILLFSIDVYIQWEEFRALETLGLDDDDGWGDDDGWTPEQIDQLETGYKILFFQRGIGFVFAILGILGACKFQRFLVLASFVWFCCDIAISIYCDIATSIYRRAFFPGIVTAIIAQPHFSLFRALSRKQLTKENYAFEKYCCCTRNSNS